MNLDPVESRPDDLMDKVVSLCRRRGFIFQSSEIYGGINALYDYGPLGVSLKNRIRASWWSYMVDRRDDVVGLDCSIIMNPQVWVASGHVDSFSDPMVDCKGACKQRWRADHIEGDRCPNCGGELTAPRQFNLMFKTFLGPLDDQGHQVYLRPETAQGMFVNFRNVLDTGRVRPPFGIAQVGRSFRNEISPGNFIFRSREFEQMEMEYFVPPGEGEKWMEYWKGERMRWYTDHLGVAGQRLRLREHGPQERAHYATSAADIEYLFPFGWQELEGIALRGDYDLTRHQQASRQDLTYFDQASQSRYLPHVVEPAAGLDRTLLTVLIDAYDEEVVRGERRVLLRLDARIAPIQVAVLPLSRQERLSPLARRVAEQLRGRFLVEYDETQSIGRRYRRQDEIGTPYCVTIDFESLDDACVTVRDRDSMAQLRLSVDGLVEHLDAAFFRRGSAL